MRMCSVEGCAERHFANTYCRLHNQRWKRKGDPLDTGRTVGLTTEERFFRGCERRGDDECWPWRNYRTKDGYGAFWDGTKNVKGHNTHMGSHRWAYLHWVGEIPEGLEICHNCDNPWCVNPAHLYADTHSNNASRAWKLGRQVVRVGEKNGRAKMTEAQVTAARSEYKEENVTIVELARRYGVNPVTMGNTLSGRLWKHLPLL